MRQEARFKNIRTTQYALLYNRLCSPVYTLSVKKRTLQAYFNPLKKRGESMGWTSKSLRLDRLCYIR